MMAPGVYDIPRVESRARVVVTTTTSTGAYRGAGRPEATAAIERAMDLFAAEIGRDPAEVRRRNLVAAGRVPVPHQRRRHLRQRRVRPGARPGARGRGTTPSCGPSRRPAASAATWCSSGSGSRCSSRSPAAARSPRTRRSRCTPTARSPCSPAPRRTGRATPRPGPCSPASTSASRSRRSRCGTATPISSRTGAARWDRAACRPAGVAVYQAAGELVELAKQRAADLLEADVDDLVVADGAVSVRGTDTGVTLAQLAEREQLRVDSTFDSGKPTFPFGAHLAVVEVDVESGKAVVDRIVTVDDAGSGAQPAARRGPAPRRHRPGHRAGPAGGGRLRRRRQPADGHLRRLRVPVGRRAAERSRCWTWPLPPRSTRWGSRGSARPARSAPPRRCRAR